MTIEAFADAKKVCTERVRKWIRGGYIPGASLEEDYVPDSARVPYTAARARKASSIYCSIVKAANEYKHVVPKLYGLGQDEFDGYIRRLKEAGLIELRVSDGITYYDATIEAMKCTESFIIKAIEACAKGIASGVTEAYIAQATKF